MSVPKKAWFMGQYHTILSPTGVINREGIIIPVLFANNRIVSRVVILFQKLRSSTNYYGEPMSKENQMLKEKCAMILEKEYNIMHLICQLFKLSKNQDFNV